MSAGGTVWTWSGLFGRCKAVKEPNASGYWGRCELRKEHPGDHLLERGMEFLSWSTAWTTRLKRKGQQP